MKIGWHATRPPEALGSLVFLGGKWGRPAEERTGGLLWGEPILRADSAGGKRVLF
jgi:hypothetical protein